MSLSSKLESRLALLVLRACSLGLVDERELHEELYVLVLCSTTDVIIWL